MIEFNPSTYLSSKKLLNARKRMNRQQERAFTWSLYALSQTKKEGSVEVDLSEFLGLDFMPNSYTKEDVSKAFKALTKPCISLDDANWIPAYRSAQWQGDIMLLDFNPEVEKQVLKSASPWASIVANAQRVQSN